MRKWLFSFFLVSFVLLGLCSHLEAKSNLDTAKEFVAAVENLPTVKEIDAFLAKYLDKDVAEQVKESEINKFAWKISKPGDEETWWVIFEHKTLPIARGYKCKGDPPDDATIILSKGERKP
jgi:hypothetical protein